MKKEKITHFTKFIPKNTPKSKNWPMNTIPLPNLSILLVFRSRIKFRFTNSDGRTTSVLLQLQLTMFLCNSSVMPAKVSLGNDTIFLDVLQLSLAKM